MDGIADSMNMSLSKVRVIVKDGEVWHAAVHGVTRSWTPLTTEQQQYYETRLLNYSGFLH